MREIEPFLRFLGEGIQRELHRSLAFGCVTEASNGSHNDMTYRHFCQSQESLLKSLRSCPWEEMTSFAFLRRYGCVMEKRMFEATGGVNTHKGLLFLVLFLAHAWTHSTPYDRLSDWVMTLAGPLREDDNYKKRIHRGIQDVRSLPLTGFREIMTLVEEEDWEEDLSLTLALLERIDDTTTIQRSSLSRLRLLQEEAGKIRRELKDVHQSVQKQGLAHAEALSRYYVSQGISSGGVADCFVITHLLGRWKGEEDGTNLPRTIHA